MDWHFASRAGFMSKTCFQHGPHPSHRILEFQRGRGFGGHVPRAGAGGSPLAQRPSTLADFTADNPLLTGGDPALPLTAELCLRTEWTTWRSSIGLPRRSVATSTAALACWRAMWRF